MLSVCPFYKVEVCKSLKHLGIVEKLSQVAIRTLVAL